MKRRTPTDDELQVGEARKLVKLRSRVLEAMAAEADMEAMFRARAALVAEFKTKHADDPELCAQAAGGCPVVITAEAGVRFDLAAVLGWPPQRRGWR